MTVIAGLNSAVPKRFLPPRKLLFFSYWKNIHSCMFSPIFDTELTMNDSGKGTEVEHPVPTFYVAHKQKRALQTREDLIRAARAVFARDGFEHARIEEIAAQAGKTRGAFYANFEDKEDVFFAIFEEDLLRDQERVQPRLQAAGTTEERIDAVTEDLLTLLRDRQRLLLGLEFKMYAIRRPQKQNRLAELHSQMLLRCCTAKIDNFLPELAELSIEEKRRRTAEIAAILDGAALNRLFDPSNLGEEQLRRYLRLGVCEAMRGGEEPGGCQ
jgi:AcrR family transcriptional regulator